MRNYLTITLILLLSLSIEAGEILIRCVEPTATVVVSGLGVPDVTFPNPSTPRASSYKLSYTDDPARTARVRMTYTNQEFLEKPFKMESGSHDVCMSFATDDGFYETDRQKLDSLVSDIVTKLERNNGKMKEIEAWLIKAIMEIQLEPTKP